ncbi:MAG TPA: hypothetical protein VMO26_08750 [Vicinamibacterales bacterium]|nr:hypothetical protein [Vicinamibacterales bacterium]
MQQVMLGVWLGPGCGVVDVLLMVPLDFPDKRTAMAGAFASRPGCGLC